MRALAFLSRDALVGASYRTAFLLDLLGILFTAATFYFLGRLVDPLGTSLPSSLQGGYFAFALVGIATVDLLSAALHGLSTAVRQEQLTGTLEALLVTPARPGIVAAGLPLWSLIQSAGHGVAYLLIGWWLFGLQLSLSGWPAALLALLLSLVSFASVGMVAGSFVLVMKRGDPISWLISAGMALLGGVYYPVEVMPEWLQALSNLLPITYTLRVLRASLLVERPVQDLVPDLVALALFAAALLPLGLACFSFAVRYCKSEGTLGHY